MICKIKKNKTIQQKLETKIANAMSYAVTKISHRDNFLSLHVTKLSCRDNFLSYGDNLLTLHVMKKLFCSVYYVEYHSDVGDVYLAVTVHIGRRFNEVGRRFAVNLVENVGDVGDVHLAVAVGIAGK